MAGLNFTTVGQTAAGVTNNVTRPAALNPARGGAVAVLYFSAARE
jgi:hypothetical protein